MFPPWRTLMENPYSKVFVVLVAVIAATSISFPESPPQTAPVSAPVQDEVTREQLQAIEKEIQNLHTEASRLAEQENSLISALDQYELQVQVKTQEIELL